MILFLSSVSLFLCPLFSVSLVHCFSGSPLDCCLFDFFSDCGWRTNLELLSSPHGCGVLRGDCRQDALQTVSRFPGPAYLSLPCRSISSFVIHLHIAHCQYLIDQLVGELSVSVPVSVSVSDSVSTFGGAEQERTVQSAVTNVLSHAILVELAVWNWNRNWNCNLHSVPYR